MRNKILLVIVLILSFGILSFSVADDLVYSTYLGGMSYDEGIAITVDTAGYAYVAGYSSSNNFPVTPGAYDTTYNFYDIFITKLNADGSGLIYSTYFGGSDSDSPSDIAVDIDGNVYITGRTSSSNFPVTSGAFDTSFNNSYGYTDAYVAKLNSTGSDIVYSTFLGGTGSERGWSIAVDLSGNAYITGMTNSSNFPTTTGAYDTSYNGNYSGHSNVFVTKLNATGSALTYSTFIGGLNHDEGYAIAIDVSENVYITGVTSSNNYPTTGGCYQPSLGGYNDGFVTKLNASGSALIYSTYLGGGDDDDDGTGIAVDASGNAYITGLTYSDDFPTTAGVISRTLNQSTSITAYDDAFVTKLNPTGTALVYSTYLGGNEIDFGKDITIDALGHAYITGQTRSTNFPVTHSGYDQSYNGGSASAYAGDVFVTRLNANGSEVVCSTYLGGNKTDSGSAITIDNNGNAYVTGYTQSTTFPVTPGAFDTSFYPYATTQAFVSKLVIHDSPLAVDDCIWKAYNDVSILDTQKR